MTEQLPNYDIYKLATPGEAEAAIHKGGGKRHCGPGHYREDIAFNEWKAKQERKDEQ